MKKKYNKLSLMILVCLFINAMFTFPVAAAQTVSEQSTVKINDFSSNELNVSEISDDYGNTFDTAYSWGFSPLTIGTLDGSLEHAADVDMIKFTAPINGIYTIYSLNSTVDVKGWLYDSTQTQIAEDDDGAGNRNFKIKISLSEGQTYYLKVSHFSQNGAGTYTLNFLADDYGNDFNEAHEITLSTGKNSIVGYTNFIGDVDMFKFTAPLSGTYRVYTAPVNPHSMVLYNGSMQKIATYSSTSSMAGHSIHFEYDFVQGETYYLLMEKAGQYMLDITVPDDYGNTFNTAYSWGFSPIGVKTLNGSLELATDVDMIKFAAPITGTYTIYSSNITTDMKAWLYDSNQTQIAVDDDSAGDRNFKITISLTEGQIYYLKVSHFSQNESGTYTINILIDDYGNDFNSTYGLDLTTGVNSVTGYINYIGDVDMFKFAAPSSGTYNFRTEPGPEHTVTLYNGSMLEIAKHTSTFGMAGFSVNFEFDLVQGQTYYLLIDRATQYTINITVPA